MERHTYLEYLENIRPIQAGGVFGPVVNRYLKAGIDNLPPVSLVPYSDNETYILVDGHHRTKAAEIAGALMIGVVLLQTSDEITDAGLRSIGGCKSQEDVWERYHTIWLPRLLARDITSIADLPVLYGAIAQRY